jgi:hypothetical protein
MESRYRGIQRTEYRGRGNGGGYQGRYYGGAGQAQRNNAWNNGRSGQGHDHAGRPSADQPRPPRQEATAKAKDIDLQSILKEISIALSSLAGRVEIIEKSKGSDSHSAVVNRPKPSVPAGPLPQNNPSNNNDFASVSKALYKIVQIGHHAGNWERLPKSIQERLTRLIADIKPPMSDTTFSMQLALLTQQYGEEIRRLVSDHLNQKRTEVEMSAGALDDTDLNQAKDVAAKYLTARLGKRLPIQRRTELLDSAALKVGVHRRPPPTSMTPPLAPPPAWTTVNRRTPPRATTPQVTVVSVRKRRHESSNSTPLNNRFDALSDEVIADDVESDESLSQVGPSAQPPKQQRKRAAISIDAITDVITEHGVHVYAGAKPDWSITAESTETSVIVVGDSNLKKTRIIPNYWQINALPGANLCNIANGISKLTGKPKQFTIILQAGMNHRSSHDIHDEQNIKEMLFDARRNPSIDEIYFNGVSIPMTMNSAHADRLARLNRFMEAELGHEYYIAPLDQADVTMVADDPWGIHYDQATVDRISAAMTQHVTGADF